MKETDAAHATDGAAHAAVTSRADAAPEFWGMGSMNGMGMGGMQNMSYMQNMQHMQHRSPGEREREEREKEGGEREGEGEGPDSESGRGGDIGGYRWDNHGQKVQGPSKRNVEINKRITVCKDSRDPCALIDAAAAEFNFTLETWPGDCLSKGRAGETGCPAGTWSEHCRRSKRRPCAHLPYSEHNLQTPCTPWPRHTPTNPLVLEAYSYSSRQRHVHGAGSGKHAVGVCDDGAGGAGGGAGGHVQRAEGDKHDVGCGCVFRYTRP